MDARRPYKPTGHRLPSRPRESLRDPTVGVRYAVTLAVTVVATLIVTAACSREVGHRALVFFFDGVPPLEAEAAALEVETPQEPPELVVPGPPQRLATTKKVYHHPAYWENRCGGCHDAYGGGIAEDDPSGIVRDLPYG